MANKQTRYLRKKGLSLKFNKHVDFTGARSHSDPNPEFTLVERPLESGYTVDSAGERSKRRKNSYRAPGKPADMTGLVRAYYGMPPRKAA